MTLRRTRQRFPASVYAEGTEPDPRFSLANERTFLAWIRTALALLALAGATMAVDMRLPPLLHLVTAATFGGSALAAAAWGYWRWTATERSLRRAQALPGLGAGAMLAAVVGLGVVILALGAAVGGLVW